MPHMHHVPWVKWICFQETSPRSWGPYKAPALPLISGVWQGKPPQVLLIPARQGGLFWASDAATSRTYLLVCAEESKGMVLPWELHV